MPRTSSGKMIHFRSFGGEHERHAEDQARDDGHLVGLEDVRGHTRAVTHVVPDEVGDDRRVAWVVFRHSCLDLADEVRADVRRLRVDTAAHPHEQGEERAAEAESQERVGGRHAHVQEDRRAAQEPEAVGEHARDGAGAVGDLQRVREARAGGRGHAHVALDGHAHAELADQQGEDRAEDERDRPRDADVEPHLRLGGPGEAGRGRLGRGHDVHGEEEDDRQDDDQGDDRLQLPARGRRQPLRGWRPRRPSSAGVPVSYRSTWRRRQEGVQEPEDGDPEDDPEGHDLEPRCVEKV